MLARLPEVQPGARCDPKNGWLPDKFHDQCREIATKYISEEVQRQLLEDKINMTQKATEKDADSDDDVEIIEEDEGKVKCDAFTCFVFHVFCFRRGIRRPREFAKNGTSR